MKNTCNEIPMKHECSKFISISMLDEDTSKILDLRIHDQRPEAY